MLSNITQILGIIAMVVLMRPLPVWVQFAVIITHTVIVFLKGGDSFEEGMKYGVRWAQKALDEVIAEAKKKEENAKHKDV